jgi:predicted SAM-dependent methyltransferase
VPESRIPSSVKTVPVERKLALCGLIDVQNSKGVEFGPLSRPIVRPEEGDIRYVDHASTANLREKYQVNLGHDPLEFVEVSYVWDHGSLREVIHDGTVFDYALASHVIEHVPNVVGWLNDILSVLRDGGLLGLAIPDKRYTFDRMRQETSPAIFIDHWVRNQKTHSAQQVFDHFSNVVKVGTEEIKLIFDGIDPVTERHHSDDFAMVQVNQAVGGVYLDCHASVFTPESFLRAMRVFISLGLIDADVADFYDTRYYSQEFICILRKSKSRNVSAIDELISRLAYRNVGVEQLNTSEIGHKQRNPADVEFARLRIETSSWHRIGRFLSLTLERLGGRRRGIS